MKMNISTNEGNPNTLKLVIAAKVAQHAVTVKTVQPKVGFLSRLPSIELSSGLVLFSTNAAMQLIVPSSSQESKLLNNKWLEWEISRLQPAIAFYGNTGIYKTTQKSCLWSLLRELNNALEDKQYLIKDNNDLSLADICIWVTLWSTVMVTEIGNELNKEYLSIKNWISSIELLPVIQDSIEEYKFERGSKAIFSIQAVSWFPVNTSSNPKPSKPADLQLSPTKEKEMEAVNQEEIQNISSNWSSKSYLDVKNFPYPVLPKKGEKNILITSALPYVNNVPHLGNIIGCVLSADIFARYCRQRNYNTLFISGTDEYGTATEAKALEEKTTPQNICDKFFDIHNDVYRWFNIGFDYFGRTTTPEQTEIVQSFFLKIKSEGYVLSETVDQLLCESCDRFLADRFVEGTCPRCKYEDARGDQCDGCGHLVNATDLISPRCKVCSNRPIVKKSQQFFLDLPKLENKLKEWSSTVEKGWSSVAKVVAKPWLRDGLKPRCITRDLKWGIPVPIKGFENKVFYVWFDAPFGYISITKRYTKEYQQWWKPTDVQVDLYQFMAKDNVPFHAIMFPAYLLAANEGYTLMKHLMATEYLNYEDTKFSKSRGIGVFGTDARDTGIPADVWRFYLAYIRPETQDSNFNWVDLATKNNSELLNNFGNFVNRALVFAEKYFDSKIPPIELQEDDLILLALAQRELSSYIHALEQAKLRDGLKNVLAISKHGNQYMQFQEPWVKIKGTDNDKKRAGTIIGICCNLACLLSALLAPFMPCTARELRSQLGLQKNNYGYIPDVITSILPTGHKIGKPSPLFKKIEDKDVEILRRKYAGKQETTSSSSGDVKLLDSAITEMDNKVKKLKAKFDKSGWPSSQIQIFSALKKKLPDLINEKNKSPESKSKKPETVSVPEQNGDVAMDVASLEAAIAKQGDLVRQLKAKEERSVWQPEVEKLLKLKKQLGDLTGTAAAPTDKKSKKKK
ncbi:methionyl-tRNA synthetase 1 isoform X1 [Bombus vancouverensis nearcticus]|uniref:Methionine--tRNA ligase, cytoplasmic n=3 Tax=Pyrobombus TaxID=144703 RepID=A0A6P8N2T2_9HYME|nr:methionine--tRNA ligase, cytoplasmic isoform X1 [Bombus vancouverensis nearcticus]XP_033314964.1 methionine--tRNA ligase, cytoplasmic isoform X1 [Bombus bifarius]